VNAGRSDQHNIGDTSRNSGLGLNGNALPVNRLVNSRDRGYTVMNWWNMSKWNHRTAKAKRC
jgi:hypothetical protein